AVCGDRFACVGARSLTQCAGLDGERISGSFGFVVLLLTAREHLDVGRDDFGLPMSLSPVVIPRAGLDATLDRDLLALAEILSADLRQPVPGSTYNRCYSARPPRRAPTMTAYGYVRKSVVHDPARMLSPETQEAAIRALAARRGDQEVVILSDLDVSGKRD